MRFLVYTITCLVNSKMYVGITSNVSNRWSKHIYDSKNNSQCAIHRSIRKYGLENFLFSVIAYCSSKEEMLYQEIMFIDKLSSHTSAYGYNETFGGEAPMLGKHHSDETKRIISDKLKGRISPNKNNVYSDLLRKKLSESHGKSVIQLDENKQIIAIFRSISEASRITKIANSNISGVCKGKKKTAGGFNWKYAENY